MKRSLMMAALATLESTAIATSNLFATRHTTNDPGAAKALNIAADNLDTGGGDEVPKSGHPGDLAAAALVGQQQAEAGAAAQADADAVIMAKGEVIGDDSPTTTTAVGDPDDAKQAQQT